MNIRPTENQIVAYQRLLQSEWQKDFAHDVIALVWSLIPEAGKESAQPFTLLMNPKLNGSFPVGAFAVVLGKIAGFVEYVPSPALPRFPTGYEAPRRASKLVREAMQLTTCLTLHSLVQIKGDGGFFRDVQALAFQAALHNALPSLRTRHVSEHVVLLHAMSMFAHEYFYVDPAHHCYLRSQIFDYLAMPNDRLKYLSFSLGLTPRDDHSYLTKAQEYWSELLDNEQYENAETFLLLLYRSSPVEQQAEVREMIDSAFRHIVAERTSV